MKKKSILVNRILISIFTIIMLSVSAYGASLTGLILNSDSNSNAPGYEDAGTTDFFNEVLKTYSPLKTPVNILLLAGDQSSGNTDTIMVVHYDPVTCDISIVSIPRDTCVMLNGVRRKINFAYPSGGVDFAAKTISNLLNVKLDYYVYINTVIFRKIVNILGGVDYYVPVDIKYNDKKQNLHINLKKGWQHLDGREAEGLVRFRHPNRKKGIGYVYSKEMLKYYDGGDLKRIDAQQKFIKELVKQKANVQYFTKINEVVSALFENIKTNMEMKTAMRLLYNIQNLKLKNLKTYRLGGYTKTVDRLSYFFYNGKQLYNDEKKEYYDSSKIFNNQFSSQGLYVRPAGVSNNGVSSIGSSSSSNKKPNSSSGTKTSAQKPTATKKPTVTKKPIAIQKPTHKPTVKPIEPDPTSPPTQKPVETEAPKAEEE